MQTWREIRFNEATRIELRSGVRVRPLDDRFRFRPSGDEGPAGVFVFCDFGFPYSHRAIRSDPLLDGVPVCWEVYIESVVSILSATVEGSPE